LFLVSGPDIPLYGKYMFRRFVVQIIHNSKNLFAYIHNVYGHKNDAIDRELVQYVEDRTPRRPRFKPRPGTDVMILKIPWPKKLANKLAFLYQSKAKLCKNLIITLVFEKKVFLFLAQTYLYGKYMSRQGPML
jgi:hypothetical protein